MNPRFSNTILGPNFLGEPPRIESGPGLDRPIIAEGARVIGLYPPVGSRAAKIERYAEKELKEYFDFQLVPTEENPQDDFANLDKALGNTNPQLFVALGGDDTARRLVNYLFTRAKTDPQFINGRSLAVLALGTGNDFALSTHYETDLLTLLRDGRTTDYSPIEEEHTDRAGVTRSTFLASSGGAGVNALVQHLVNGMHPRDGSKIAQNMVFAKGVVTALCHGRTFIVEDMDENGNFGPERPIYARAVTEVINYGIAGRTGARIERGQMREIVLGCKYDPRTAIYLACFGLGRVTGIRLPSKAVEGQVSFRITDARKQALYRHQDDKDVPLYEGEQLTYRLSKLSIPLFVTRRRV